MLRVKHETDLKALGLKLNPQDNTKAITLAQAKLHIPDIGKIIASIEELIPIARAKREGLKASIKARKEAEGYETAAWYEYGEILAPIRKDCKARGKGYWGAALIEIAEVARKRLPDGSTKQVPNFNRAEEAINYAIVFANKAEAARVNVPQALKLIRRDQRCYNIYENCYGTDQWLKDAVTRDYGFPGLDVCSSHGMHFGEQFYSPPDDDPDTLDAGKGALAFDGLKQDWAKDCPPKKIIWCNQPYYRPVLEPFTKKCFETAQQGRTVVQLLPPAEWSDSYRELVIPNAEIRRPSEPVLQDGFGPKFDKPAKMGRDYINVVVAIWRKGQKGFDGPPIYPVGQEPPKIIVPPKPPIEMPEEWVANLQTALNEAPANKLAPSESPEPTADTVKSVVIGNSADLIANAARLYFREGDKIADVTFGRGVFHRKIDKSKYKFFLSDLYVGQEGTAVKPHDCRNLPYEDGSIDVELFDPPFCRAPINEERYKTATTDLTPEGIKQLYADGMTEAHRVLRPEGLLLVKCQDRVSHRFTIFVWRTAKRLGLRDQDRFVLVSTKYPRTRRDGIQRHARNCESYLWVFRKPKRPKPR